MTFDINPSESSFQWYYCMGEYVDNDVLCHGPLKSQHETYVAASECAMESGVDSFVVFEGIKAKIDGDIFTADIVLDLMSDCNEQLLDGDYELGPESTPVDNLTVLTDRLNRVVKGWLVEFELEYAYTFQDTRNEVVHNVTDED